ncbi:MAG: hypothetical protein N2506_07985, partial [Dehalococcoidales bacterium]|nr:hypothetical protein [Dehalococcoidales bacterium]
VTPASINYFSPRGGGCKGGILPGRGVVAAPKKFDFLWGALLYCLKVTGIDMSSGGSLRKS